MDADLPKKKYQNYTVERCCREETCPGWWWVVSPNYMHATFEDREEAEVYCERLNGEGRIPTQQP